VTSNPEHDVSRAVRSKVDELAAPELFESDEELAEFLAAVRAERDGDLA